jgi:hypothetical protein
MDTLKNVAWFLGVLVAIFLGVGFVLPPEWEVSRDVTIQADTRQVHWVLRRLETWKVWCPWGVMVDGAVQMQTGPESEGTGAQLTWSGPDVGSGSLTLTSEDRDSGLAFDLRLGRGRQPVHGEFRYEVRGPGTTHVTLTLRADAGYDLLGRYVGWARSRSIGRDVSEALTRLKKRAEAGG